MTTATENRSDLRKAKSHPVHTRKQTVLLAVISAVVSIALTAVAFIILKPVLLDGQLSVNGQTLGQVALTESQLRDLVKREGVVAYWSGPQENALYSLVINNNHQVFVRYLPNGKGLEDTEATYRVVATYPQADAFTVTKAAGNQANAISFINGDGAQVFYSKTLSANVYLAYPDSPFEVEVFDPADGVALSMATASNMIVQIK